MKRVFVALDLPSRIKTRLLDISYGVPGAKWENENKLHLSLRFIGEVDGLKFQDIQALLGSLNMASFDLEIKGVGYFPPRGDPRILWAGLCNNDALHALQKKVETALVRNIGLKPEGRKYSPHITLARLRRTRPKEVMQFIQRNSLLHLEPFAVREFHLYASVLSPKGSKYFIESSYPLHENDDIV